MNEGRALIVCLHDERDASQHPLRRGIPGLKGGKEDKRRPAVTRKVHRAIVRPRVVTNVPNGSGSP